MLARTTMAPVGHCEYAAGGPAAREHWGPLDIHHVAKRSQRGTEEPSNLLRLCRRHHDISASSTMARRRERGHCLHTC